MLRPEYLRGAAEGSENECEPLFKKYKHCLGVRILATACDVAERHA